MSQQATHLSLTTSLVKVKGKEKERREEKEKKDKNDDTVHKINNCNRRNRRPVFFHVDNLIKIPLTTLKL